MNNTNDENVSGALSSEPGNTVTTETVPAEEIIPLNGDVSFEEELFGDDIEKNYYNYCPSIMMEGNDTMHIWYCSNKTTGNVTDYIAYRKGTLCQDGKWTFTEKTLVLKPGKGKEWDSRHTCDPSVIKGDFNYRGTLYSYMMAYLGCVTDDCTANEVGLAFAEKPEGPWVKFDENAIANYYSSSEFNSRTWGYGQPSLVSYDKNGKVLLFYTKGITTATFTYVEFWDFSDANNPKKINERAIPNTDIALNNADFAYDPFNGKFYCIRDHHTKEQWCPTDGGVNWISGSVSLLEISSGNAATGPDSIFGELSLVNAGIIDSETTGYPRNHNAGLVTDEYGWIIKSGEYPVVYTVSLLATDFPKWSLGGQWPALHTYRLHGYVISAE